MQFGDRNQDPGPDPANDELFIRNQIIEGAATDRQHSSGLDAPYKELFIGRERGPTRGLAFCDIHYWHRWNPPECLCSL